MDQSSSGDAVEEWLRSPAAYGGASPYVEFIETHISKVFLVGQLVYKLKKSVKFDFLDFSTIELREHACREELRLNRRLAPDTYRRVVAITRQADGQFQIGGDGDPVDWLVEMERLPLERTLEVLYHRGQLRPYHIDQLTDLLVRFYSKATRVRISPEEYRFRCLEHVNGNRKELVAASHHLPSDVVQRVHGFQLQLLHLETKLFDERVEQGWVVDGHGDLRPEHICLTNPPVIFDCIEFRDEFRELDVADELAFLSEECDSMGAAWIEPRLLGRFCDRTGDAISPKLFAFYKSYRASVRAKVALLRADQLGGASNSQAVPEAATRLSQADAYCKAYHRPLVLVVGGLSGTGKSTLAKSLAQTLGAQLLRSDVIRQEIFRRQGPTEAVHADMYDFESRMRVYREMVHRAIWLHVRGHSIVFDGTFSTTASIQAAYGALIDPRGIFLAIECHCRPEVARNRIADRSREGSDPSEATPELHDQQRALWEAWPEKFPNCRIDTEQPLERQIEQVLATIRAHFSG